MDGARIGEFEPAKLGVDARRRAGDRAILRIVDRGDAVRVRIDAVAPATGDRTAVGDRGARGADADRRVGVAANQPFIVERQRAARRIDRYEAVRYDLAARFVVDDEVARQVGEDRSGDGVDRAAVVDDRRIERAAREHAEETRNRSAVIDGRGSADLIGRGGQNDTEGADPRRCRVGCSGAADDTRIVDRAAALQHRAECRSFDQAGFAVGDGPDPGHAFGNAIGEFGDRNPDALRAVADVAAEAQDRAAVGDAAAAGQADAGARVTADQPRVNDGRVGRTRFGRQFVVIFVLAEEVGGDDAVGAAGDRAAVGDARPRLRDDDAAARPAVDAAEAGAVAANVAGIVDGDGAIVCIDADVEAFDILVLGDDDLQRFGLVVVDAEGLLRRGGRRDLTYRQADDRAGGKQAGFRNTRHD